MATERKDGSGETDIYYFWFPTDKDRNQNKNPSTFDHVNLKNAYVTLNSDRFPVADFNLSFSNQNCIECMVMQPCFELNSMVWMN